VTTHEVRRHRRLDRPKERFVEEAWALLVERGLADLSLSELGRRLDTSAGHLAYYFGSKDGLLLDVLRWTEEELGRQREVVMASTEPVEVRLRRFTELFVPRGESDPRWLVWLELWPRLHRDPALKEAQVDFDSAWRADLTILLHELGVDGVDDLARRILALLDGLSIGLVIGDPELSPERAWDHVKAVLPLP
jgi:AcrR family transcriptional regulator